MGTRTSTKRYGVVRPDAQAAMGGLELLQGLVSGSLPLDGAWPGRWATTSSRPLPAGGVVVTALAHGRASQTRAGTVHGGLAATLLDSCMGLAVWGSTIEKGFGSTTLEFKISFVRPILPDAGQIRAEGIVIAAGRRIRHRPEGRLTDKTGRLLAHGTTTCLIFER